MFLDLNKASVKRLDKRNSHKVTENHEIEPQREQVKEVRLDIPEMTGPSQTASESKFNPVKIGNPCSDKQVSSRKQRDEIPHRERVLPIREYKTFERWLETSQTLPRRADFINKLDELCKEQSSVKQLWKFCQELSTKAR